MEASKGPCLLSNHLVKASLNKSNKRITATAAFILCLVLKSYRRAKATSVAGKMFKDTYQW